MTEKLLTVNTKYKYFKHSNYFSTVHTAICAQTIRPLLLIGMAINSVLLINSLYSLIYGIYSPIMVTWQMKMGETL